MWTDPRTWATGEVITQSLLNTHLRDNLLSLIHPVYHDPVDKTVSNTTSETTLFTAAPTIAAGALGTKGVLYIVVHGTIQEGTAATCALKLKYGGSNLLNVSDLSLPTTSDRFHWEFWVHNRASESSQYTYLSWLKSAGGANVGDQAGTSAIDTSASGTLDLTLQFSVANANNNCTASAKIVQLGQTV